MSIRGLCRIGLAAFFLTGVPVIAQDKPEDVQPAEPRPAEPRPAEPRPAEQPVPGAQADSYYDPEAMARARAAIRKNAGGGRNWLVMADRLEAVLSSPTQWRWEGDAWLGGDIDKLWLKTEGEYVGEMPGRLEEAEVQILWSRAISTYFDFQAGIGQEIGERTRTSAVIGIQGLAPYWFEIDAAAFIRTDGTVAARLEIEYDLRLTRRLILQPRAEAVVSYESDAEAASGERTWGGRFDFGLRLRYEMKREFAPYAGLAWRIDGRSGGESGWVALLGVRMWY